MPLCDCGHRVASHTDECNEEGCPCKTNGYPGGKNTTDLKKREKKYANIGFRYQLERSLASKEALANQNWEWSR